MFRTATVTLGRILAFLLVWVGLSTPVALHAQQGVTTGSISGRVTDPAGQPQPNAIVRVTDLERGAVREVLTDDQGRFRVALLRPGRYSVRAEFSPLQPVEVSPIEVSIGERTAVTLALQPAESEELMVTVGPGVTDIDVTQGGVVELIDQQLVSELPTAGRDFTDFISLSGLVNVAGVEGIRNVREDTETGGQFSILGARSSAANITIDGVDANNQFFGENRGGTRLPFTFTLESIREFQIITSGYDVEYGRFAGGQINAVTRGGTNEFSGEAWLFGRDEALTADNFDGTAPADFQSYQFGGRLSGPIVRDELHFFVSGDLQQRDQPTFGLDAQRANIPQATIDQIKSVYVNTYGFDPAFVDRQFGVFSETQDQVNLFGRLDWTLDEDHRLTVRGNYSDFENLNDELRPDGRESRLGGATFESRTTSVMAELNSSLSQNVYNTLRLQYADESRPRTPNSQIPFISFPVESASGATAIVEVGGDDFGINFRNNLEEDKFQITNVLNIAAGDHQLKVGTDNVFTDIFNMFWLAGNGLYDFDDLDAFAAGDADFFLRAVPDLDNPTPPTTNFSVANWSFFVQDEWQVTDKLRLMGGVRWDYQDFNDAPVSLADPTFQSAVEGFGVDVTATPSDTDNFGPRFSFTYDTQGNGRELVRGGLGIFYDDIPIVTHGNTTTNNPDPLLFNVCIAAAAPDNPDLRGMNENPSLIPSRCAFDGFQGDPFGIGIVGTPDINVWDPDVQSPRTLRANLGYERRLGDRWKAGIQGIFSRTWDLFRAVQLNRPAGPVFSTADGRPVFVAEDDYDPEDISEADFTTNDDIRLLFQQTDGGDARSWSLKLDLQGAPTNRLRVGASYTLNVAKDNGSTECCTAFALAFDEVTAGDASFIGDPGDEDVGAWGPSKTEQRHVLILHGVWNLPAGFQVSTIYRGSSGPPFTPRVAGDLNADGEDSNDRPFIPDPATAAAGDPLNLDGLQFASQGDLTRFTALLDEFECLREAVGSIINRNTCNDPWWHSWDIKVKKTFTVAGQHHFELVADVFNVLDGLGIGAGEFTFFDEFLYRVPSADDGNFDTAEDEVIVEVLDFGREIPAGFDPFQFQAQLGVRYRF